MNVSNQKKMPLAAKMILGFVFLIFMGSGGRLLFLAFDGMREAGESASWPRAEGKVIRSEMNASTRNDEPGRRKSSDSKWYEATVEYEFEVNGMTYRGSRIAAVKDMNAKQSRAQATLDKYPVDRRVMVSYKPDDPSVCVLEPGSWGGALIQLGMGVFFVLVPLGLVFTLWRLSSKNSTPPPQTRDDDQFTAPRFDETE
ncbi:MAG: DUF3592 domain-containing protein [Planctomycetaceae bacterium]|nr:DUF3592 domain-containing protein [Planctomycetaceae bacterium]